LSNPATVVGGGSEKKTADLGVGSRAGGNWKAQRGNDTKTVAEFNFDRLDRALLTLGRGVVDEFQAAGFDERTAWQASMAAIDAATARLDQVAAELIGGAA